MLGAAYPEPQSAQLLDRLLEVRDAILASGARQDAAFISVWDFDGTILDGDCSEGLKRDGRVIYPGLAQLAIENGLSALYPRQGGFDEFWRDYTMLDERIGHWIAYPFILQMLRGASTEQLSRLAASAFQTRYSAHYFAGSMYIIHGLQAAGVEVLIISASAEAFVRGAAATLNVDPEHINGIRVSEREGRLTEELIYPVSWADGKRRRLEEILQTRTQSEPGRQLFVIGGFGNSYGTDGPFLAWIGKRPLPAAQPVVVMINGGPAPAEYAGEFTQLALRFVVAETAGLGNP